MIKNHNHLLSRAIVLFESTIALANPAISVVIRDTCTKVLYKPTLLMEHLKIGNGISNTYTMGCQHARGDNPRALRSGLSYVHVKNMV